MKKYVKTIGKRPGARGKGKLLGVECRVPEQLKTQNSKLKKGQGARSLCCHTFFLAAVALLPVMLFLGCAPKRVDTAQLEGDRNTIKRIESEELDGKTRITIEADSPVTYTAFKLSDPLRIVVDINEADISGFQEAISVNNGTVGDIEVTQFEAEDPTIGRVEVFLDGVTGYNIEKDKNFIYVLVDNIPFQMTASMEDAQVETAADLPVYPASAELAVVESEGSAKESMERAGYIADLSVEKAEKYVKIIARGDGYIGDYNSFILENPSRIVVDIVGVKNLYRKNSMDIDSPFIKTVRIGQHPDKVRFVFAPAGGAVPEYGIKKSGQLLEIIFGEMAAASSAGEVGAIAADAKAGVKSMSEEKRKAAKVTAINFKQMQSVSRIGISFEGSVKYEVTELSSKQIALDIKGSIIPKNLQRSLDTTEFDTPVDLISSYQLKKAPDNIVRVVVALREGVPYEVSASGNDIYIDFARGARDEVAPEVVAEIVEGEAHLPLGGQVITAAKPSPKVKEIFLEASTKEAVEGEGKKYVGQRVSLDYKDADIGNILRLFAEVSGLNIIAAEDVKGTVTVRLDNVPWDQALDIILQAKRLGMSHIGNVIRIAPSDKIHKEEEAFLAAQRAKEVLTPLVTETIQVSHMPLPDMEKLITSLLTKDRGLVDQIPWRSSLRIRDVPEKVELIRKEIRENDVPIRQVLIEARIVEVDTNYSRSLGVQWGGGYSADAAHGNPLGMNFPNSMNVGIGGGGAFALNPPSVGSSAGAGTGASGGSGAALGFSFGSIDNTISLDLKLSALETQGVSKIISRPRIVTMDGKQAAIQQGFSIPFETTSADGTQTEFVDANLNLTVTPEIKGENIVLAIKAAKNEPDFARTGAGGAPSISKKEATTEVLIKDGDTTVIGGIFTQKKGETNTGVPFLSKIPLIGWLFKSKVKTDDKAELLIFITPRIVKDKN